MCLHYDGISLTDQQTKRNVEHIVVKVSAANFLQTLDVLAIDNEERAEVVNKDYTFAELVADKLIDLITYYEIAERIKLVSTDTARLNTAAKGITSFLESKFERVLGVEVQFVRFNCKHHEDQLLLRHLFEVCFGSTAGAREPFLDRFAECFHTLDVNQIEPCSQFDEDRRLELIVFIDSQLPLNSKRADYKELLNLARYFLIRSENPTIFAPGKYNHSRFIKQLSVCLMICLFRKQLPSRSFEFDKIEKFCKIALDLYLEHWFQTSVPAFTPANDLKQFKFICSLTDSKLQTRLLKTFKNHSSYLKSPLVSLAFFDERIPKKHKARMVRNLQNKPKAFDLNANTEIFDLVDSDCISFFEVCNLSSDFLDLPIDDWKTDESYLEAQNFIKHLPVTNDTAEQTVSTCKFVHNVFGIKNLGSLVISSESDRKKHAAPTKASYSNL